MATTNYAKADAILSDLTKEHTQSPGFRGGSVECDRSLGTYYVRLRWEAGYKHTIPKKIDRVEIEVLAIAPRNI